MRRSQKTSSWNILEKLSYYKTSGSASLHQEMFFTVSMCKMKTLALIHTTNMHEAKKKRPLPQSTNVVSQFHGISVSVYMWSLCFMLLLVVTEANVPTGLPDPPSNQLSTSVANDQIIGIGAAVSVDQSKVSDTSDQIITTRNERQDSVAKLPAQAASATVNKFKLTKPVGNNWFQVIRRNRQANLVDDVNEVPLPTFSYPYTIYDTKSFSAPIGLRKSNLMPQKSLETHDIKNITRLKNSKVEPFIYLAKLRKTEQSYYRSVNDMEDIILENETVISSESFLQDQDVNSNKLLIRTMQQRNMPRNRQSDDGRINLSFNNPFLYFHLEENASNSSLTPPSNKYTNKRVQLNNNLTRDSLNRSEPHRTTQTNYWNQTFIIAPLRRTLLSVAYLVEDLETSNTTENVTFLLDIFNETEPLTNETLKSNCTEWDGGRSTLFQIGNLLYLVAFLIPPNFAASALVVRCALSGAMALLCAWAAVHICAMDVLSWCAVLLIVNVLHALRLVHILWPARIQPELEDLYNKLFKPLKVTRDQFAQLAKEGCVEHLPAGHAYAQEDETPAAARLAVLVKGRLGVSCDSTHLHYVFPNQFADSVEWEAAGIEEEEGGGDLFQVTVLAEVDCVLLVWQRDKLLQHIREKNGLGQVLAGLAGKDITTKLYSLTEQQQNVPHLVSSTSLLLPGDRTTRRSRSHSVDLFHTSHSQSADLLHTGHLGLLRSSGWQEGLQLDKRRQSQHVSPSGGVGPRDHISSNTSNGTATVHSTTVRNAVASSYDASQSPRHTVRPATSFLESDAATVINTSVNATAGTSHTSAAVVHTRPHDHRQLQSIDEKNGNGTLEEPRKKQTSVVRLVSDTVAPSVPSSPSLSDDTNAVFTRFTHGEFDASTFNLLDNPELLETAV